MPCVHHLIGDAQEGIEVVSEDDEQMSAAPRTPKRESHDAGGADATPAKTSRKAHQPSNADLMDFPKDMKAQQNSTTEQLQEVQGRQTETTGQLDQMFRLFTQRIDGHDADLAKINQNLAEMNENIDNLELTGLAQPDPKLDERLKSMEEDMLRRLALLEQEMLKKGPPAEPQRGGLGTPVAPGETDTVVIGGFKRDTPKGQIIKTYERILQGRMQQRFGDMFSWEVCCPYLLSSVLFIRCPSAALARQAVNYLRSVQMRFKLGSEEITLWTTLQNSKDLKDRSRRLMRMASCLQGHFAAAAPQVETYKLVCWRSGSIVAFDQRVAQLKDSQLTFFDGWHRSNRYTEQGRKVIEKQLLDTLNADLESSRS